jgi:glycerol kinase
MAYAATNNPAATPIMSLPTPIREEIKLPDVLPKAEHAEYVNKPGTHLPESHLPKGVTETDQEVLKKWFIGSIDQGTTSSRFLIFDGEGTPVAGHQIEFENIYPESG